MAEIAHSVLSARATSVSSEGIKSWAGIFISIYRRGLDDVGFYASFGLESWDQFNADMKEASRKKVSLPTLAFCSVVEYSCRSLDGEITHGDEDIDLIYASRKSIAEFGESAFNDGSDVVVFFHTVFRYSENLI